MGIRDFFRHKTKNNYNNNVPINNYQNIKPADLTFNYRSGITCEVEFLDLKEIRLENGEVKLVQQATIKYIDKEGKFEKKEIVMDPEVVQDENGNYIYDTKQYYQNLSYQNLSLAKGFFDKRTVDNYQNGYIGYIGFDKNTGKPNRSFDQQIRSHFDKILYYKNIQRQAESEKSMRQDLQNKIVDAQSIECEDDVTSYARVLDNKRNNEITYDESNVR